MKRFRFCDVPKHQKLSHFFTYYSLQAFAVIFAAVVVLYLLYLAVLAPKTDVSVIWISNTYSLEADGNVAAQFEQLDWDDNGDGKSVVMVQHAEFGESFAETDADSQIALMTILSAGDTDILLVSEAALEWGIAMEILGTNGDFGSRTGMPDHEIFAVNCAALPFFADSGIDAYETMYLTIRKPREEPEAQARYLRNMKHLAALLEWGK